MPRTLQFKRYGSATLANTTGANGELIINSTNQTITVHDGVTPGGYATLNSVTDNNIDQYARNTANTNSNNISIIQGVDTTQNTRLNSIETINANQNTSISIIQGVNTTQNTNITTVTNLAQAAFNTANNANTRTVINGLGVSKLDFATYGSNTAYLTTTNDDSTALFMGAATAELYAYTSIQIRANTGGTSKAWTFGNDGGLTFPDNTIQTTAWTGSAIDQTARNTANTATNNITIIQGVNNTQNTNITTANNAAWAAFTKANNALANTTGSWTVTTGANTYSFTVPSDGTYTMWVKGNIANGIIIWNATLSISNSNVPAIGTQYAWNYTGGGSPILLTTLPDQIRGTANTISTDNTYVGSTSNKFDFGISNSSGSSQTIYYGYTKI
jgi:hypothetical protein